MFLIANIRCLLIANIRCLLIGNIRCLLIANIRCLLIANIRCLLIANIRCLLIANIRCLLIGNIRCLLIANIMCLLLNQLIRNIRCLLLNQLIGVLLFLFILTQSSIFNRWLRSSYQMKYNFLFKFLRENEIKNGIFLPGNSHYQAYFECFYFFADRWNELLKGDWLLHMAGEGEKCKKNAFLK